MKIYISGKITGLDWDATREKFNAAAAMLSDLGFDPFNPMEGTTENDGQSWEDHMSRDIAELFRCDAIFMLPDWIESKGARIEYAIAVELDIGIAHPVKEF